MERKTTGRKREPSRLALQLAEAFAPCAHWSQVRVQREGGRRTKVVVDDSVAMPATAAPFAWSADAL